MELGLPFSLCAVLRHHSDGRCISGCTAATGRRNVVFQSLQLALAILPLLHLSHCQTTGTTNEGSVNTTTYKPAIKPMKAAAPCLLVLCFERRFLWTAKGPVYRLALCSRVVSSASETVMELEQVTTPTGPEGLSPHRERPRRSRGHSDLRGVRHFRTEIW